MTMERYWLGKANPEQASDQPETPSTSCYRILKMIYLTEFSTD